MLTNKPGCLSPCIRVPTYNVPEQVDPGRRCIYGAGNVKEGYCAVGIPEKAMVLKDRIKVSPGDLACGVNRKWHGLAGTACIKSKKSAITLPQKSAYVRTRIQIV